MNSNYGNDCVIDVESFSKAIDCLDLNKAPGCDNLTVEHILFAHESVIIILRTLFNIMLRTGLVPDSFGIGKTTPIPKFKCCKKNVSADDFRGITICPILSKNFEYCIKKFIDI